MRPADNITRFINQAAVSTNPQSDKAVLEVVLAAHEEATGKTSAATKPSVRSIVMGNSYVKLAFAAVVILAVILELSEFLGRGGKSGVAWAQVLEKVEQVPAVVFDMTAEIAQSQDKKLVMPSKNYVAGDYGTRSDVFLDGQLMVIKYRLPNQKVAYQVRVDRKQYWRVDLSDEQAAQGRDPDDPRTWLKMILSSEYTKLGSATINGVATEGIECRRPELLGADGIMRLWVDVQTNLPVRIEVDKLGVEGGQMRPHKFVMENFEWNAHLNESLFEPNIPADYTPGEDPRAAQARQEAQPASPPALTEQEQAAQPKIKETARLYLEACRDQNWDEIIRHAPGLAKLTTEQRAAFGAQLGGLEITQIGEPFKAPASDIWQVPCRIKWKGQAVADDDEIRVRHDQTLGRFVICGGP